MGTRIKTYEATGIAPNGRIYAGDLNAIQDDYADLSNYSQQVDVSALSIGETALKLLRYGAGEARISGALRIDGIFRGLGGVYAGAFTTAQRDAIAAGLRPYGLIILNTTTNRLEWNQGTDAVPNWQPVSDASGTVPIGTTIEWPWIHTQLPTNFLLPYGQAISRAAYPILHAIAAASAYPHGNGDGSTTFNLPDYRGRVLISKDDMGGTAAGRITSGGSGVNGVTLGASGGVQNISLITGELPAHSHGSGALTVTGSPANGTLAATVGSLALPNHGHIVSDPGHNHSVTARNAGLTEPDWLDSTFHDAGDPGVTTSGVNNNTTGISVGNPTSNPAISGSPSLSGSISAGSLDVGGTTDSAGSGTAHQNVQPSIVVNRAMRVL